MGGVVQEAFVVRAGGELGSEGWTGFPKAETEERRRGLLPLVGEEETANRAQRWHKGSPSQGLKSSPDQSQWKEESVGSLLIHFEFIFVYGVRKCSNFILLQVVD